MTTTASDRSAAPVVDPSTAFGAKVVARLGTEPVIWLTTVGATGTPQPNPVWFQWRDDEFLLFSKPDQAKLRNLARNPRVSLNFNSTEWGGEVMVFTGTARIDDVAATPDEIATYTTKYADGLQDLGLSAEQFFAEYSAIVRIRPDRLRGF
ncbi:TIGR03667 family PPOX class F420-dependent oxidoreductase [Nocardia colli]|uniref:TIGR03667 family PPOX class F420-dependent oxidoreductase n=1 Tax=Nocardia colli TaxID=2545717 RepID=A0A5N0ECV2_9NOCA|nr:TIGR03667 family PPOX class F420-dependent oxidoreductase [Nocardia colli]KAA8886610.1 TIGR03667 family PPOX class F420-dependent oxidoreductase [Nocardia colli]